jgi:hypothetical protein
MRSAGTSSPRARVALTIAGRRDRSAPKISRAISRAWPCIRSNGAKWVS